LREYGVGTAVLAAASAIALFCPSCSRSPGAQDDRASAEKVEKIKKTGGVEGLKSYLAGSDGTGATKIMALEEITKTPGPEAEKVLLELAGGQDSQARDTAIRALVERKSEKVVPVLVSRLLNTLETGGDVAADVAAVNSISPDALRNARDSMIDKANKAKSEGSIIAAKQYIESAQALSAFVDKKDLSGAVAALDGEKKAAVFNERAAALIKAMENGQLSRMYTIGKILADDPAAAGLKAVLPEMERLSRLEDRFYSVAQAQESTKSLYEEAKKKGEKGDKLARMKNDFDTQKGNMILARRELERERKKLPALAEKVGSIIDKK
jgi:hypothetical protein